MARTANTDAGQDLWYLAWLAAALLSKALAVVVPPIVLLYDVFILRRRLSDAIPRQIIPGLMSVLLLLKTMAAQQTILGGLRGHLDLSLLHIIAIDVTILWQYVWMLLSPADLCVLYDPHTTGISGRVAVATAGWTVVVLAAWRLRHRSPLLIWSMATGLLLLLPVLNFFRITTLMNDRYLYLPCIVLFAVAATGMVWIFNAASDNGNSRVRAFAGFTRWSLSLGLVVAALSATSQHLPVWQNSFALWNHAMTQAPQLPAVRMQLALTHYDCGLKRQAVDILHRAMTECQPDEMDRQRLADAANRWSLELDHFAAGVTKVRR